VAGVVTFFGKDMATSGPGRYHIAGNPETWSGRFRFESELCTFIVSLSVLILKMKKATLTGFISHSPAVKFGLWNGGT
jgi:hypothetical protein